MKYLFTLILTITTTTLFAQVFTANIATADVGTSTTGRKPIKATEITFPYKVYKYEVDTVRNELFVTVRKAKGEQYTNTGFLALIDLNTNKVKWAKKMIYFNTIANKDHYQIRTPEKIYSHTKETDATEWQRQSDVKYILPDQYIGYSGTQRLVRVNENDGTDIWKKKRKVTTRFGLEDIQYINDTTVLFAESGLHMLNTKTGAGWDYELKTGRPGRSAGAYVGFFFLGGAIGVGIYTAAQPREKTGLHSGILMANGNIYYSSIKALSCLDASGHIRWQQEFDSRILGNSVLIDHRENVVLFDRAVGYRKGKEVRAGRPFLAAYDKNDGKLVYRTDIDAQKFVTGYVLNNDTLMVATNNALVTYNITNGATIASLGNKDASTEPFTGITDTKGFYTQKADGTINSVADMCGQCYLLQTSDHVILVSPGLAEKQVLPTADVWKTLHTAPRYEFLQNEGTHAVVATHNGSKVADLMLNKDARYYGNKIYYMKDNKLVVMDVADIE